jgi:hypothetical protein
MADVLERCHEVVPDESLPLELEYETQSGFVSQFPVAGFEVTSDAVVLRMGLRHTECLAPELCVVPAAESSVTSSSTLPPLAMAPFNSASTSGCGCGPSGCC